MTCEGSISVYEWLFEQRPEILGIFRGKRNLYFLGNQARNMGYENLRKEVSN